MELIEVILSKENLNRAYKKVVANKGAGGVDGVAVEELGNYIRESRREIITSLRNRTYIPKPVRRVYIPKDNGKKRPLGIPTALDRTIQQQYRSLYLIFMRKYSVTTATGSDREEVVTTPSGRHWNT